MFNITSEKTYQDGQIIIDEGSSWNGIYVLVSGTVEISKTVGGKKSIIELLKEGEVFGEADFLGSITRTATVRAIGETTVGIIDRASLDKEFNKLSSGFRIILLAVVRRFKKMIDRTCAFSSRKEARVLTSLSLRYEDKKSFVDAFTLDLSGGGLFISTEHLLKEGEQFLLKLQLPGVSEPLKVKCEVVWTRKQSDTEKRPPGMGVKFCEMTKKDLQILNQYLQL